MLRAAANVVNKFPALGARESDEIRSWQKKHWKTGALLC
jgi:hypothetical protein